MDPAIALAMLLVGAPGVGVVQHRIEYRMTVQRVDSIYTALSVASAIDGRIRVTDELGVEASIGLLYGETSGTPWFKTDTQLVVETTKWFFGNPLLGAVYAGGFGDVSLRVASGVALPIVRTSAELEPEERGMLTSAVAGTGGWELWRWAPRSTTWLSSILLEHPISVLRLRAEGGALLMIQNRARGGARFATEVALRPLEFLELGVRVQGASMLTRGRPICFDHVDECVALPGTTRDVLDDRVFHFSLVPGLSVYLGPFSLSARATINLTEPLGFRTNGGPYWGVDLSVGVASF